MIVVRVELWSARDGSKKELARMHICNDETGTSSLRNYIVRTLRGRSTAALDQNVIQRQGVVKSWPSQAVHIWNLVAAALAACRYSDRAAHSARSAV